MVRGMFKSGHFRRVERKLPGGKTTMHYREALPKQHKCGECEKPLPGIPRMNSSTEKNTPKTLKRPQRPYGGVLCSACMRKKLISQG